MEHMNDKLERRKSRDYRPTMMETLRSRIIGGSMSNLANIGTNDRRNTYSAIINGGTMTGKASMSSVQRKILANKNRLGQIDDEFKVKSNIRITIFVTKLQLFLTLFR